jgi:hypothetical protein
MNKSYLQKKIRDLFIVHEYDGSYNLFGTYSIKQQSNGAYKVLITDDRYKDPVEFSALKYAVSWCVFEKNQKHKELKRLYELDQILGSIDVSIAQHQKLMYKTGTPDKFIFLAKLNEDKLRKKQAIQELAQYTSLSRHIQEKKFTDSKDEK